MISKEEWRLWTRGNIDAEREFGLTRKVIGGYNAIPSVWKGTDEYAAVFSCEQIAKGIFDTILMDIDAHVEGHSWRDKKQQVIDKAERPPSREYETGRGAHLYWDLEEPITGAGRYKQAVTALVKRWGIKDLVDPRVVGDVRRMARLPSSVNSKSGLTMIRVSPDEFKKVKVVVDDLIHVEEQNFGPVIKAQHVFSEGEYPPCVRKGIQVMMETGELDHSERLHVFSFLVGNGEKQKGWELLKNYAGDFDAGISAYQLGYIERKPLKPSKCVNVPDDICPYAQGNKRECVYWPSINLHREKRLAVEARNDGKVSPTD